MANIQLSPKVLCGYCFISNKMEIKGRMCNSKRSTIEPGYTIEYGKVYKLCLCSSCGKENVYAYDWSDFLDDGTSQDNYELIYPSLSHIPIGMPNKLIKAYHAAQKVKGVDVNAFVVLTRRLLEMMCKDKNAEGHNLAAKLKFLSDQNLIPSLLSDIGHKLRNFGNWGAHDDDEIILTNDEVPIVESLTKALLEYVYSAPYLAMIANNKMSELKK